MTKVKDPLFIFHYQYKLKKKILVIDDDEGIVDALQIFLEASGFNVETSRKAEEIFDRIDKFKPDVVLLDVLMSGIDGRQICKKLKADTNTKKVPVVMISAHPSAHKSITDSGAEAFLAKPFETSELLQIIAQVT